MISRIKSSFISQLVPTVIVSMILGLLSSCQLFDQKTNFSDTKRKYAQISFTDDPRNKIIEVVKAMGGNNVLEKMEDVQLSLENLDPTSMRRDFSTERYIFKDKLSFGEYQENGLDIFPGRYDKISQLSYDSFVFMTVDGKEVRNPGWLEKANITRRINYGWFTFLYQLNNPSTDLYGKGKRKIGNISYDLIEVSNLYSRYQPNSSGRYTLYINPRNSFIDFIQFQYPPKEKALGQVLIKFEYMKVGEFTIPVTRKWFSCIDSENCYDPILIQNYTNIRFKNGFSQEQLDI